MNIPTNEQVNPIPSSSTAQAPSPSPEKPNNSGLKIIVILLSVFVVILLAVIVGGGIYFMTSIGKKVEPTPTLTPTMKKSTDEGTMKKTEPTTVPLYTTQDNNNQNCELQIDKITPGNGTVTIAFTVVYKDNTGGFIEDCSTAQAFQSYLIDETAKLKYEPIRDAKKAYVAESAILLSSRGERRKSGYTQFTAPPKGSTVDIYIYGYQPIYGVKM